MKSISLRAFVGSLAAAWLCLGVSQGLVSAAPAGLPENYKPAPDEFAPLAKAVLELLQSGDTGRFATNFAPSAEDWKSILSTNLPATQAADALKPFLRLPDSDRRKLELGAKAVLEKAAALHLDFSKGDWHSRVISPERSGSRRYTTLQTEKEGIPHVQQVEVILYSGETTNSSEGNFKLAGRSMAQFPGGWRILDGVQWTAFPKNIADERTQRELVILDKAANYRGIDGQDDPALLKLGELLVRFIRERNVDLLKTNGFATSELLWGQIQKSGRPGPSREELDKEIAKHIDEQANRALDCLKQMNDAGIDLKNADIQIQQATVDRVQPLGPAGSIAGLMGSQFKLKLAVKSEAKAANGTALSGDYILAATQIMRFEEEWRVRGNVQWYELPNGILSREVTEKVELENYVAEHRCLPPGTAAPEIEFTTLEGEKQMKLSAFRGKVVVLDFWATWCGPCQEPMAELQKLPGAHPDWADKVVILPLSIDDTLETVRNHVNKRGWTNTFNTWVGSGDWHSQPATAFRVSGVPTTYIIDGAGKIVTGGHPARFQMQMERIVESLLKPGTKPE